ncbi:MAG: hypothetical protein KAT93_05785, partial [Desulfuromonadales bacterium]|nr:hypothetical protein [Desulfuromonadales bacterium]
MTQKTQTALDMSTHPALLINRKSRLLLEEADLEHFIDAPLDLAAARKVGHALETSGAHLFLFAQLNAALRCMCRSYLEHHDFQPGWKTFLLGGTRYRCQGLGEAFRLFQRHYLIRRIPAAALRADGRGKQIGEARQKLAIELCLLDTQSENPALRPLHSLFMEKDPARRQVFQQIVDRLSELPGDTKAPPLLRQPLRTLLRAPMQAAPDDLTAQVTYAIEHWGTFLPADLLRSLTVARAIVLEEAQSRLPGPGPDLLPDH